MQPPDVQGQGSSTGLLQDDMGLWPELQLSYNLEQGSGFRESSALVTLSGLGRTYVFMPST
jgi:hypothetical protein